MTDSTIRLGFADGFRSLPRAFGVTFRAPRILLWLLPPLLITVVLDGLAFYFAFGWIRDGIDKLLLMPVFVVAGTLLHLDASGPDAANLPDAESGGASLKLLHRRLRQRPQEQPPVSLRHDPVV